MLQDYPQFRKLHKFRSFGVLIEFLIVLLLIQMALVLLYSTEKREQTIQFRIVAHSNAPADQRVKKQIQQMVEPLIQQATLNATSKQQLVDNLFAMEQTIYQLAQSQEQSLPIQIERKMELLPTKRTGHYFQPQGRYDTFVLTVGSGRGDNWWCALFPKICYDEEEPTEEEPVTFFLWEWIKKIFSK